VNAPLIFEPPPVMLAARSITAPQIMIGASGGDNWGGCDVYLSLDSATYKRMGRIAAPSRQGVLANTLASGTDPDTAHTLSVDMSESGRALGSGITADADAFRTLCYVDGELIAYEMATLTGSDLYGLTYLRRGVYNTTISAHAAGSAFCRLDESVKSFDLPVTPVSYVGQTLYLKFLSYNIYGGGQQQLSAVSPYTYVPGGSGVFVYPPTGVSFSVGAEQQKDGSWISFGVIAWTASQDPLFDQYEVQWRLHTGPGAWTSLRIGPDTTSHRISPLPNNTAYDIQVRAVRTSGPFYSAWDQTLNITTSGKTTAPPAPTSLSVVGGYRQIEVKWTASAENDIAWYEVWEGSTNVLGSAVRIALVNATHYLRPGLNLSDTRFFWIKAQDTSGNFSTYLGPGSATTNAVDAADITGKIIGSQIDAATITGANLANNIIDYSKMASNYGIAAAVNVLPGPASPLRYAGSLVLLNSNAKLYRWDSVDGAWTVATDGGDITANSIVANSLVAGIITAPYIAADAVTANKLFVGDTTNLVNDPIFQDINTADPTGCYWSVQNIGSPVIVSMGPTPGAVAMGAANGAQVSTSNIPAASGLNYGVKSQVFAVKPGLSYRASCSASVSGAGVNKTCTLFIQWFQSDGVTSISNSGSTAYMSTSAGADGSLFSGSGGDTMLVVGTAPSNAAYARLFWCVQGGGSGAPAGAGSGWQATHMRMERQTVGTLIQNGQITTDHIVSTGLDAGAITAGTITADRMVGNFLDGGKFTASDGATVNPTTNYVEMLGLPVTLGGHVFGPYFSAVDGAGNVRVVMGRFADQWGLHVWNSAGVQILSAGDLGVDIVGTTNLQLNAVTYLHSAQVGSTTLTTSYGTLWSMTADATGTLAVTATGFDTSGLAGGSTQYELTVNGTAIATWTIGGANFDVTIAISAGDAVAIKGKYIGTVCTLEILNVLAIIAQR
jgi:hypothetical protein